MQDQKRLQMVLFVLVILAGVIITLHMFPPALGKKNIRMVLTKNKKSVKNLDIVPTPDYRLDAMINTIDFPVGDLFKHSRLGGFGFQFDFFAEFTTTMRVHDAGNYIFKIGSDDGFRLFIGPTMIGEFVKDRPYQENIYRIALNREDYPLILRYFQGYGPLGLRAYYQREGETQWFFIGEDSRFIHFLKQQH